MMSQGTAIALGLLLSFLIYAIIPVIIAFAASKTIQPSKYRNLCFLFNLIIVAVSWTMAYGEESNGTFSLFPYVLWTSIAVAIGKGILDSRGKLSSGPPKVDVSSTPSVQEPDDKDKVILFCENCGSIRGVKKESKDDFCIKCAHHMKNTGLDLSDWNYLPETDQKKVLFLWSEFKYQDALSYAVEMLPAGAAPDDIESLDDYLDGESIGKPGNVPASKPTSPTSSAVSIPPAPAAATKTAYPASRPNPTRRQDFTPISVPAPKKKKNGKTALLVAFVLALLVGIVGWVYYSSYTHARAHALVGNFTKADQLLFARSITERHDPLLLKYEDAGLTALAGDYESAEKQFQELALVDYEDSQRRVYWCRYEAAKAKFDTDMASAYAEYQDLVKVGFMSQESLDDITESIYQQGLTFYQKNNQKQAKAYLNVINPYKRSDDYLTILNKNDYHKLLNLIGFENAKKIIEEKYIMRYVSDDWETEDGRYFFTVTPAMDGRSVEKLQTNISSVWYQLPLRVAGGSFFPDVSGERQDIFTYEIIDANTMDLTSPAYKKTYTLYRKDKIEEEPVSSHPSISTWENALPTTPAVSVEESVILPNPAASVPDVKSAAKDAQDRKDGLQSDGKIHVYLVGKGETISAKNSYSIRSMTYYEESDHLVINFGGKEYAFANVGSTLWASFKAASSSDSYYDHNIKGNKAYWINDYNGKNGDLIVMEYVDSGNQQSGPTPTCSSSAMNSSTPSYSNSYTPAYAECIVCGRSYSTDMMYDMGGDYICEGCLDSGDFATCEHCGNIYPAEDMYYFDYYLCENCLEKLAEEYDGEYEDW